MNLSVIIVNWNTRELLQQCLDSLFANLGSLGVEVIVVDNASTDGSQDMVRRSFSMVRLIESQMNSGFASANNKALRISAGRYVLLLNSDTVILGDVLSQSVRYMDEHPDVGVFGCRVLNPDGTMQPTCFRYPTLITLMWKTSGLFRAKWPKFLGCEHMNHWLRDSERDVDVVTGCYFMVRRTAVDQVGLMDEQFFFCGEETDWCKRFSQAKWKIRFAPVGEILHIGNASGKKQRFHRDILLSQGLLRYYRKHNGLFVATIAWLLILTFVVVRVVAWGILSVFRLPSGSCARQRFRHFINVLMEFSKIWPKPNLQ